MVTVPVYVFAPLRVSVPEPALLSPPLPVPASNAGFQVTALDRVSILAPPPLMVVVKFATAATVMLLLATNWPPSKLNALTDALTGSG